MKRQSIPKLLALIVLAGPAPLPAGDGDCCIDNGTPGCVDPVIEACVCAIDPFCCEEEWDTTCAAEVVTLGCDGCLFADCNGNGIEDSADVETGTSDDCDSNGVPDECDVELVLHDQPLSVAGAPFPGSGFDVDAGDFDSDGDLDLLTNLTNSPSIAWRENVEGGLTGPSHPVDFGLATKWGVEAIDVDGDGDSDVLASYGSPGLVLAWYENLDGLGSFGPAQTILPAPVGLIGEADFDRDGDVDFVGTADGSLVLFKNNGSCCPWFEEPIVLTVTPQSGHIADLDSDGALDLLITGPGIRVLLNVGGPSIFGEPETVSALISPVTPADLDGDGDVDIVASKWSDEDDWSELGWYENTDGAGSFGPYATIVPLALIRGFVAADADGDGDQDLIVSHWERPGGFCFDWGCTVVSVFERLEAPADFADIRHMAGFDAAYHRTLLVAPFGRDFEQEVVLVMQDEQDFFNFYRVAHWLRNDTDDCNGNGSPDVCDADCDGSFVPDDCEIAAGAATDCSGNGVPDECDTGCPTCDADGDGCFDDLDGDALDPTACGDTDGDGCDDCTGGGFDPAGDGTDVDGDGICDATDCDDGLTLGWWPPSEAGDLLFEADETTLGWQPPQDPGGTFVRYDTLRSDLAEDFAGPAICLETDDGDTEATDAVSPAPAAAFFYLVRSENACPDPGTLGADSEGVPREGRDCP